MNSIKAYFSRLTLSKKIGFGFFFVLLFFLLRELFNNRKAVYLAPEPSNLLGNITEPAMVMRNDTRGLGHYHATRVGRLHDGLDVVVTKGQVLNSPFNGTLNRTYLVAANDSKYTGIELISDDNRFRCKIMYCYAISVGQQVQRGEQIAFAQAVSEKYGSSMIDHVHIELFENGEEVDPAMYFDIK